MFHQILIALFFQIILLKQNESMRFYCDSDDDIKNASKHLKRLIRNDDKIYFVFPNRIIFTKMPKLFKSDINFIDENDSAPYLFINYNFYETVNEEIDSPERIPKGFQVLGHSYDKNENKTKEFYVKIIGQDEIVKTEILNMFYELDFKGSIPAKRLRLIEKGVDFRPLNFKLGGFLGYVDFFSIIENEDNEYRYFTKYLYGDEYRKLTPNHVEFFFVHIHSSTNPGESPISEYHFSLTNLKSQLFIADYFSTNEFTQMFFFGLNQVSPNFILGHFVFLFPVKGGPKYLLRMDDQFVIEYNLDELFSCPTPFVNDREIKGIYYDKRHKLFFIFIKRFYLQFDFDLIENGFQFEEDVYLNRVHYLEPNNQIYSSILYENLKCKWVKSSADDVFYIPFYDNYDYEYLLKLQTDEDKNLVLKETKSSIQSYLNLCIKQTLVIDDQVYCFTETHYFFKNFKISIETIFDKSPVHWDENERVKFIFNYKDSKVAFHTLLNLFVFNYSSFRQVEDNKLIHRDDGHLKIRSCLIIKCEQSVETTSEQSIETTTEASNENIGLIASGSFSIYLLIASVSIITFVILAICYNFCLSKK